ncbi:MAG TPA: macrolide ABC transporter permease, partial [Lachnospiraceae bacterium]|nr:macrolide ABC transporter permease [Lachnospiraceae bacterium]
YGQWFTWEDYNAGRDVAVIAEKDAVRIFGTSDVVGMTFELDDTNSIRDVRIVGVKKNLDGTFVNTGYGSYLDISMPMTADWYWAEYNDFDSVYIYAENGYAKEVANEAISLLEGRHEMHGMDAFLTEDFDSQMASIMQVLDMITIFIMLVAAISLLVGGIG